MVLFLIIEETMASLVNLSKKSGNDLLIGGDSNDRLSGLRGDDSLYGNGGDDQLYGGNDNDYLAGGSGNDYLDGGNGNDYLAGGSGNDHLIDSSGNNTLIGGDGNDRISAYLGSNLIFGDSGNDTIFVYSVANQQNTINGGDGTDTLITSYAAQKRGVNLHLASGDGTVNHETYTSIESFDVTLTSRADYLDASAVTGGITVHTQGGADTIIGGSGTDTLDASFSAPVHAVLSGDSGTIGDLSYSSIEEFQFSLSSGTDYVDASALTNGIYMHSGDGDDTLIGSQGQDTLYADDYAPFGWGSNGNSVMGVEGGDIVRYFVSGEDRVLLDGSMIGNGDAVIDGATTVATGESFSASSELVIISSKANFPSTLNGAQPDADSAAAAIGSASDSYAVGQTAVFVVNNGFSSAVWSFESADTDGQVSASELTLVATLTDTSSTTAADYLFGL
jgi:hypothetical protein